MPTSVAWSCKHTRADAINLLQASQLPAPRFAYHGGGHGSRISIPTLAHKAAGTERPKVQKPRPANKGQLAAHVAASPPVLLPHPQPPPLPQSLTPGRHSSSSLRTLRSFFPLLSLLDAIPPQLPLAPSSSCCCFSPQRRTVHSPPPNATPGDAISTTHIHVDSTLTLPSPQWPRDSIQASCSSGPASTTRSCPALTARARHPCRSSTQNHGATTSTASLLGRPASRGRVCRLRVSSRSPSPSRCSHPCWPRAFTAATGGTTSETGATKRSSSTGSIILGKHITRPGRRVRFG